MTGYRSIAALVLSAACAGSADARGRFSSGEIPNPEPPAPALLKRAGFDQRLGDQVSLDLIFRDEQGKPVKLRDVTGGKPIILNLAYFGCPMLCTEVVNGMMEAIRQVPYEIGKDFAILTVSFDPKEDSELASSKKANYIKDLARPGAAAGWHFLTGDQPAIAALTASVGFTYEWDPVGQQYGHASGIVVLTPDGKISHYFYGVRYPAQDVRLALVDAAQGKIGSPVDKLLLFCFHYDPVAGKYSLTVMNLVRAAGLVTLLALGMIIIPGLRRSAPASVPPAGSGTGGASPGGGI
jgi:protein SCO1/2